MNRLSFWKANTPVSAATLIIGLAVGFAIGKRSDGLTERRSDARTTIGSGDSGLVSSSRASGQARQTTTERFSISGLPASIEKALANADPLESSRKFAEALSGMSSANLTRTAKALWATPGSARDMTERKRLLAYRWGQVAGSDSIVFAMAQSGQGKATAISAALAGWASRHPGAVRAWIDTEPDESKRRFFEIGLIDGWTRTDLDRATAYVLENPEHAQNARLMRSVAAEQVRTDPQHAGEWAQQLPAGALQTAALDEVASLWAWADGAAASDWIATISDQSQRRAMVATAMEIWTRANPEAASAYLTEMPPGVARDELVDAFSRSAARENPEASGLWAATISDSALREQSLLAVAREWMAKDRESALAWMASSGISPHALSNK